MGSPAQAPVAGMSKVEAQARSYARQSKGELVHITNASGDVRIQRAGRFEWESVPADGMTVHQGVKVKTAKGARATVTSQSRGEVKMGGGRLFDVSQEQPNIVGPPQPTKLRWGTVVKSKKRMAMAGGSPQRMAGN